MSLSLLYEHPWDVSPKIAVQLQVELGEKVVFQPLPGKIDLIAGVDVSYKKGYSRAAVVILKFPSMAEVSQTTAQIETPFPYVPGLLSFRELPAVLAAIEKLELAPDVWMCDAQGIAHPRRIGLASHLGVLLDAPTVGCAKSILVGSHPPLGIQRGNVVPLKDGGEIIGAVVRTRNNVKPMIVSVGHLADLDSAVKLTLACGRGLRMPEPTRLADKLAGAWEQ